METYNDSEGNFRMTKGEDYLNTNYEMLEFLGSGSFSDVFSVRSKKHKCIYAVKKTKSSFSGLVDRKRKIKEVHHLWLASGCDNCIQIVESWEQRGHLYIVMEFCSNGRYVISNILKLIFPSLQNVIEFMWSSGSRFTEFQIWQILRQISKGLEFIHQQNLVHLDIKPANILINSEGILKIGDFGLSTISGHLNDDMEGDKYYVAPEVLDGKLSPQADIFSLGLLILELAADIKLPSQGSSWQNLRHGDFSELNFDSVSDDLKMIIQRMTHPDPTHRPSTREIQIFVDQSLSNIERLSGSTLKQHE